MRRVNAMCNVSCDRALESRASVLISVAWGFECNGMSCEVNLRGAVDHMIER